MISGRRKLFILWLGKKKKKKKKKRNIARAKKKDIARAKKNQHNENKPIQYQYIEKFISKNWKFWDKKDWYFEIKKTDIFHISAQNIDCGCGYSLELPHLSSSNEYQQSMFLSRNKKNNVYPCKPQFYYIKVGFQGVNII